eukprot:g17578.t1
MSIHDGDKGEDQKQANLVQFRFDKSQVKVGRLAEQAEKPTFKIQLQDLTASQAVAKELAIRFRRLPEKPKPLAEALVNLDASTVSLDEWTQLLEPTVPKDSPEPAIELIKMVGTMAKERFLSAVRDGEVGGAEQQEAAHATQQQIDAIGIDEDSATPISAADREMRKEKITDDFYATYLALFNKHVDPQVSEPAKAKAKKEGLWPFENLAEYLVDDTAFRKELQNFFNHVVDIPVFDPKAKAEAKSGAPLLSVVAQAVRAAALINWEETTRAVR